MAFIFEKLIVYQKSLLFVQDIEKLKQTRSIQYAFIDQLLRASLSIPLNIAEGNGRWHAGDKRNFFWIARGSVFECVPLIQLLRQSEVITETEYKRLYAQLEELSKMITTLVEKFKAPEEN